jgi:hypothetical protein
MLVIIVMEAMELQGEDSAGERRFSISDLALVYFVLADREMLSNTNCLHSLHKILRFFFAFFLSCARGLLPEDCRHGNPVILATDNILQPPLCRFIA